MRKKHLLPRILSEDEIEKLMDAPDSTPWGRRDAAILETLYASGLRVSELASINVNQVSEGQKRIRITGKGDKERDALLGAAARNALDLYLEVHHSLANNTEKALFVNRFGSRLSTRGIREVVSKYGKKIGKRCWPHKIRHSFATHLLDHGVNIRYIQELLGHEDVNTTMIYTHVSTERLKQCVQSCHPLGGNLHNQGGKNHEAG